MFGEVVGAGTDYRACLEEPASDQGGVAKRANTKRNVDIFLQQVDAPVAQVQVESHAGMVLVERVDRRTHVEEAEREG